MLNITFNSYYLHCQGNNLSHLSLSSDYITFLHTNDSALEYLLLYYYLFIAKGFPALMPRALILYLLFGLLWMSHVIYQDGLCSEFVDWLLWFTSYANLSFYLIRFLSVLGGHDGQNVLLSCFVKCSKGEGPWRRIMAHEPGRELRGPCVPGPLSLGKTSALTIPFQ